jgi:hypothetical protein
MKLILDKNVAEIYKNGQLVIRLKGPCGCVLDAHIPDPEVINVVKVDGVTACVEGDIFAAIDVQHQGCDKPCG